MLGWVNGVQGWQIQPSIPAPLLLRPARQVLHRPAFSGCVSGCASRIPYAIRRLVHLGYSEVIGPTIVFIVSSIQSWHTCAALATALAARLVQLVISPAFDGHYIPEFVHVGNLCCRSSISGTSCWFRHSVTVAISSIPSKWARYVTLIPAHGAISSRGSCS